MGTRGSFPVGKAAGV